MRKFYGLTVGTRLLTGQDNCNRILRPKGLPFLPVILLNSSTTDRRINIDHSLAEVRGVFCIPGIGRRSG
jgi:hypothetical protein